ncbi:MAG: hypothetical protein Q7R39_10165 [Dehalococcoidia bacterium]|nr:hypothetical protein [Dehalococcoidia bacterium]
MGGLTWIAATSWNIAWFSSANACAMAWASLLTFTICAAPLHHDLASCAFKRGLLFSNRIL